MRWILQYKVLVKPFIWACGSLHVGMKSQSRDPLCTLLRLATQIFGRQAFDWIEPPSQGFVYNYVPFESASFESNSGHPIRRTCLMFHSKYMLDGPFEGFTSHFKACFWWPIQGSHFWLLRRMHKSDSFETHLLDKNQIILLGEDIGRRRAKTKE